MKTTLELPDDLVREIKLRAVHEGRKLKDVIADLLRTGLTPATKTSPRNGPAVAKNLPKIKARPAQPADAAKLSTQEWCDWLKDVDLQLEVERYEKAFGHQHVDLSNVYNDPAVSRADEPAATRSLWLKLADRSQAAPNVWMDAYLAAFAIAIGAEMFTFDRDFATYQKHGLSVQLLESA